MALATRPSPATWLRVAGILLAALTLAFTFRDAEPSRVGALLSGLGGLGIALLALPQLLSLLVESAGWKAAFEVMGHQLPLFGLLRARLASEALAQTLPMGVVFCESIKPTLLARTCGADLSTSLAGMAARKWLLVTSQCVYVATFGLLAFAMLERISHHVTGAAGLPYLILGASAVLSLLAGLMLISLSRGQVASRSFEMLCRLPWIGERLLSRRAKFTQADRQLQRFFASPRMALPLPAFLCSWFIEAAETALILHLLGVHMSWQTIGAVEVSASFVRNVACVVPAGLGVQDLSYLAFLRALGVPDAVNVAAAFLVLKRAKECFWALVGYGVLAFELRLPTSAAKRLQPGVPC